MSDFFKQLAEFSERVFQKMEIEEKESPWSYGFFKTGFPTGAILHFTSGSDIRKTIRWFMKKRYSADASANVIVDDRWLPEFKELSEDFPLVHRLPTMVIQCLPPNKTSWHARWVNSFCYGIEMVNLGEVRNMTGTWMNDRLLPMHQDKDPVYMYGKYWDPYPVHQVLSVIEVLRELRKKYGNQSLPRWMILGHENVQENKYDPGPLFPLNGVRLATYEDMHPSAYYWFNSYAQNPLFGKVMRERLVMDFLGEPNSEHAWEQFYLELCDSKEFGEIWKVAMRIIGYFMPTNTGLSLEDKESIGVFQRMKGLKIDGIPGPITRRAILDRFEDRGFMP